MPSTIYPMTEAGVTAWMTNTMHFRKDTHERLFAQYLEARRIAESTAAEIKQGLDGGSYRGDVVAHLQILEKHRFDVGLAAEALLLTLDALLTSLRYGIRRDARCTDDGPELRNGVTVDRAVDAIGNYVRHQDEWFSHDSADTWPNEHQLRSIRPIAQLYTSRPIEDAETAYKEFTAVALPPAYVLDLLGDYETVGTEMKWSAVESTIRAAALASINRHINRGAMDSV